MPAAYTTEYKWLIGKSVEYLNLYFKQKQF